MTNKIEINDAHCLECEKKCRILYDKAVGLVSECCGVGFSYIDELDKEAEINGELRYVSDWND